MATLMAGLAGFTSGEGGENARGQIAKTRLGARFVGRGLSVQGRADASVFIL